MNLSPEHRGHLYDSGLNDEMIQSCQYESVRPHDLKLKGVESAFRLPYSTIDGVRNCFERLRLFPPILDENGHRRKYHQEKDTPPSLYLTPTVDWKDIASDPTQTIAFVEGEKKLQAWLSAPSMQLVLAACGAGGNGSITAIGS